MLRYTSTVALDNTPVLSSYEIIFRAKSVKFVDLCRLYVSANQDMKARVLRFIFFYVEVITTEAQFVTDFIRHKSAVHFLLELIDASVLIKLQCLSILGEGIIRFVIVPPEKLVVGTKVIIMLIVSEGLIVVVHDYSII